MGLKETLPNKQKFTPALLKISKDEIIEPVAIPPAIIAVFMYMPFGILLTISPDQAEFLGLQNKGFLFTSLTVFSIMSRLIAGKVSDRFGRIIVIKYAAILVAASLVYFAFANTAFHLMAASGCLGFSCLLYTSPSPRDRTRSRMPSSA